MTAFDNIKTNNWPAFSNEFEDYLVLEIPFNDQAALTSSRRDIYAGSKLLHPKHTLTPTNAAAKPAGPTYSDTLTVSTAHPNNTSPTAGFDGDTTTSHIGGVGATVTWDARGYSFPANSTVEVYSYTSNGERSWAVDTGSGYGSEISESAGWQTLGTYSNIQYIRNSSDASVGYGPGFGAIRINGVLLIDPAGGDKKHYDNNAVFSGTGSSVTVPASPDFNLSGDFTIETWMYQDAAVTNGVIIGSTGYYNASKNGNWILRRSSGTQIAFATYDGQSNSEYSEFSCTTSVDTWNHLALTRRNTTVTLYLDGVAQGAMTVTKGLQDGAHSGLTIGNGTVNAHWNGKFQDLRVYNGVAKYASDFTPPGAILA